MRPLLIALALVLLVVAPAAPAAADSFMYNVTGLAVISGVPANTACNGGQCVQAIAFSLALEMIPNPNMPGLYMGSWAPSSNVQSFGPLAPFTMRERIGGAREGPYYIPFTNGQGDEIDLKMAMWTATPWITPGLVDFAVSEMYVCRSDACVADFLWPGSGPWYGGNFTGVASVRATRVPEPMTLLMVGAGLAGLFGARTLRRL